MKSWRRETVAYTGITLLGLIVATVVLSRATEAYWAAAIGSAVVAVLYWRLGSKFDRVLSFFWVVTSVLGIVYAVS